MIRGRGFKGVPWPYDMCKNCLGWLFVVMVDHVPTIAAISTTTSANVYFQMNPPKKPIDIPREQLLRWTCFVFIEFIHTAYIYVCNVYTQLYMYIVIYIYMYIYVYPLNNGNTSGDSQVPWRKIFAELRCYEAHRGLKAWAGLNHQK